MTQEFHGPSCDHGLLFQLAENTHPIGALNGDVNFMVVGTAAHITCYANTVREHKSYSLSIGVC